MTFREAMSTCIRSFDHHGLLTVSSIIMEGSSPFPYQSPSFHSSSYLPKMEANFMKDFRCCGLTLPTTHELVQHYEENHTQQMAPSLHKDSSHLDIPSRTRGSDSTDGPGGSQGVIQSAPPQDHSSNQTQIPATSQRTTSPASTQSTTRNGENRSSYDAAQMPPSQDIDSLQDMDMDLDDSSLAQPIDFEQQQYHVSEQPRMTQRSQFGQPPSSRVPPLNLNTANLLQQHQGLRTSTPTTPIGPGRTAQIYQHNPTVSSVNTPTLSAHPRHQQQYVSTPDSSVPGTPGEPDFGSGFVPIGGQPYMQDPWQFNGNLYDLGNGHDMLDLCIDEPAKRLFHNSNKKYAKQSSSSQLGDGQYSENSELARTIREQQRLAGVPDPQADGGVPKPFHCPVIGCEKAYKNQNGLKYHKAVCYNAHFTSVFVANVVLAWPQYPTACG